MNKKYTREEIKNSLIHGVSREMGICETLRSAYDEVYKMPDGKTKEQLTEKLVTSLLMAKKIADRLAFYAEKYKDPTGSWGEHLVQQRNDYIRKLQVERGGRP